MFCKSEYQKREGKNPPVCTFFMCKGRSLPNYRKVTRGAIERQKEGKKNQRASGTLEDAAGLHYFFVGQ